MTVCPRCGAENRQGARFCDTCGAELAPAAAREQRKTVTVLFCDVTGSTQLGERLDPESLRHVLARYFDVMKVAVNRHGGTVEKFVGDAVMAVFGVPTLHEDDALRAVRAAREMQSGLAELNMELAREHDTTLAIRIGINSGEVVTGTGERLVTGDPVNVASRLEQAAAPGEIILGAETVRLLRGAVEAVPLPPLQLKGKAEPVTAFRLLGVHEAADDDARGASTLVGRRREERRLNDAFDQALDDRTCQLFTVLGHAGVGKSRLVQEFIDGLGGRALVARGRCLPYGEGITYWPLLEALKEAASIDEADSPQASREKIAALAPDHDALAVAQRVSQLVGLEEAGTASDDGFAAVERLFVSLALRRPLVLVFDDIHWAEPTFLDLIEHLADWTRDVPLLVICVARPELLDARPAWGGGKLNATTFLLEPLSAEESAELVENLGGARLDSKVRGRVIEAAEGNPLFVEEMLALAREGPAGSLSVPPTIQALLAARLDQLADEERSVVERAAVEGKIFHEGSVFELSPEAIRPGVAAGIAGLVRKELIRPDRAQFPGQRAFRFRHILIRDAAYDSVPKQARAELHENYAGWLERSVGDRVVEYEEIIGYHLEQAVQYRLQLGSPDAASGELGRRAAERLAAAGRRAFARSDAPAGLNLISRAAALLPADDPARIELVPNVRVAQGFHADLTWVDEILGQALATGDVRRRAHALVQRGFFRLFTEQNIEPEELVAVASEAISTFTQAGDDLGLARAWRLVAQARYLGRDAGGCVEASEKALVHARRAGDVFEVKEIVEWLVVALALGPAPAAAASRRCEELLDEVRGDRFLEVTLFAVRAHLETIRGRA